MMKMIQTKNKKLYLIWASFVLAFFLSSCNPKNPVDFSPRIYKQILKAQDYIKKGKYQLAVDEYNKILNDMPAADLKVKIYYQLGDLHAIHLNQLTKGVLYFKKVLELTNDPVWLVKSQERLGEINYTFLKDYNAAKDVYKRLVDFKPKLNKYQLYEYRLAKILLHYNEVEELKKLVSEILKNKSHEYYVDGYYILGQSYFQNKDWNKAIGFFKEYLKREKRRDKIVNVKFLIGNCYETLEKLKNAYNIYYSILGDYPNTKVIQDRLKSVYDRRIARKR